MISLSFRHTFVYSPRELGMVFLYGQVDSSLFLCVCKFVHFFDTMVKVSRSVKYSLKMMLILGVFVNVFCSLS